MVHGDQGTESDIHDEQYQRGRCNIHSNTGYPHTPCCKRSHDTYQEIAQVINSNWVYERVSEGKTGKLTRSMHVNSVWTVRTKKTCSPISTTDSSAHGEWIRNSLTGAGNSDLQYLLVIAFFGDFPEFYTPINSPARFSLSFPNIPKKFQLNTW